MIRSSTCMLCLLQRTSKRYFSVTKVQWKQIVTIPLTKHESLPVQEKTTNHVTPKPASSTPLQLPIPPIKQDLRIFEELGNSPSKLESKKIGSLPKNSTNFSSTNVDVRDQVENISGEDLKEEKPLQLVNAADPSLLDKSIQVELKDLPGYYLSLSKFRLTGLVVVTAMAGYALAPAPVLFFPLLSLSVGTALTSAAANTINQIVEVQYDSQMDRTKNRVLVKGRLSREHAAAFAVVSGVTGLAVLNFGANSLTAALGAVNLLLYTCMYTPLKRHSIVNTWVGSVVGGIPPIMGWAACTGELSHGALLLGGILYAWQFPHFNALSWNLKNDYGKAGYKMMAVTHPELCKKTALRYSLSLIAMSSLAPVCSVTSWTFALDSLPLNGYLVYLAYKFYEQGDSASSRKLFRFSLIHLPALIMLMMISKQNWRKEGTCSDPNKTIISEMENQNRTVDPILASIGESIISQQEEVASIRTNDEIISSNIITPISSNTT